MNVSPRTRLALRSLTAAGLLLFLSTAWMNAHAAQTAAIVAPAAVIESLPTVVITAKRSRRVRSHKPLLLSVPRFSFANIAIPSTVSGSFNSSVNYLQREMRTAHHAVEDISLFRFRLTQQWSLQWDFSRVSQPADRVLGLNVGLYHEF